MPAWNCRSLTILARCLIAKTLGIAQLVHTIPNLNISKAYIQTVNFAFLYLFGKIKKYKIKRRGMISDFDKGGCTPSIDIMAKSIKLAWISRLSSEEENFEDSWKAIPNYLLDKFGGLNFLLKKILQHVLELKDVRANYFCASLLRTQIHMPRHA